MDCKNKKRHQFVFHYWKTEIAKLILQSYRDLALYVMCRYLKQRRKPSLHRALFCWESTRSKAVKTRLPFQSVHPTKEIVLFLGPSQGTASPAWKPLWYDRNLCFRAPHVEGQLTSSLSTKDGRTARLITVLVGLSLACKPLTFLLEFW